MTLADQLSQLREVCDDADGLNSNCSCDDRECAKEAFADMRRAFDPTLCRLLVDVAEAVRAEGHDTMCSSNPTDYNEAGACDCPMGALGALKAHLAKGAK